MLASALALVLCIGSVLTTACAWLFRCAWLTLSTFWPKIAGFSAPASVLHNELQKTDWRNLTQVFVQIVYMVKQSRPAVTSLFHHRLVPCYPWEGRLLFRPGYVVAPGLA